MIRQEVEAKGAQYRHTLITRTERPAPDGIAARMNLPPGTPLLYLETLHLADGHPHASEIRWINPVAVPGIMSADLTRISANEWLVQNAFYTRGDIGFSAEAATPADAELLSVPEGAPLFVLDRLTWMGDAPITAVRVAYAPGHRMTTTL